MTAFVDRWDWRVLFWCCREGDIERGFSQVLRVATAVVASAVDGPGRDGEGVGLLLLGHAFERIVNVVRCS